MSIALMILTLAFSTTAAENRPEDPRIKDYVTGHYAELQDNLQKGDGASLVALFNLLQTPADQQQETIKRLRALAVAYPTVSEFTDHVPDFTHKEGTPAVASTAVMTIGDLKKLFVPLKYKTRIHLSMTNGDEIDGIFTSFDPSREIIWAKTANASGGLVKKAYHLQQMKNVLLIGAVGT
jgi:hypothetical protein